MVILCAFQCEEAVQEDWICQTINIYVLPFLSWEVPE